MFAGVLAWAIYLLVAIPGWIILSITAMASLRPAAKPRAREWILLGVPCGLLFVSSFAGAVVLLGGPTTLSRVAVAIALGASPIVVIVVLLKLKRLFDSVERASQNALSDSDEQVRDAARLGIDAASAGMEPRDA
jgi:membrane protein implicated in regulation of membrane protease activity